MAESITLADINADSPPAYNSVFPQKKKGLALGKRKKRRKPAQAASANSGAASSQATVTSQPSPADDTADDTDDDYWLHWKVVLQCRPCFDINPSNLRQLRLTRKIFIGILIGLGITVLLTVLIALCVTLIPRGMQ